LGPGGRRGVAGGELQRRSASGAGRSLMLGDGPPAAGPRPRHPREVARIQICRLACAQSRPHRRAHGSMSHCQHHAECPPTVQRDSGGASLRPCLVGHRVVRRSRQAQPAHASCAGPPSSSSGRSSSQSNPNERPGHDMQATRLGVSGGTSSGGSPQTRRRCSGEKPCPKINAAHGLHYVPAGL
jgi:hypothetical protein